MTAMSDTMDRLGQTDEDIFVPKYFGRGFGSRGGQSAGFSDFHLFAADVRDRRRLRYLARKLTAATASR
jgi:hypothetical protein